METAYLEAAVLQRLILGGEMHGFAEYYNQMSERSYGVGLRQSLSSLARQRSTRLQHVHTFGICALFALSHCMTKTRCF